MNADHPGSTLDDKQSPADSPPTDNVVSRLTPQRYPRRKFRTGLVIVAAVFLVILAVLLWRYFASYESTDDAQVDVHLYPVSARVYVHFEHVAIDAGADGIEVNVDDNQHVDAGTVLVEIDPKDYQVAVDKARADLANAEATAKSLNITVPITSVSTLSQLKSATSDVENANAGIIAAEQQLDAARAQLEEAEANDVKAQDDLKRYKRLVDKQNVSEQTYDQALAAAKASSASVAAAHANEAAAQQAVRQANDRLVQAEASHNTAQTGPQQVASTHARALAAVADVQQKRAALEQAELNLGYTKIVAPASG